MVRAGLLSLVLLCVLAGLVAAESAIPGLGETSTSGHPLVPVESILNQPEHPWFPALHGVCQRMLRINASSGVIWRWDTYSPTALFLTAWHTIDHPEPEAGQVPGYFGLPQRQEHPGVSPFLFNLRQRVFEQVPRQACWLYVPTVPATHLRNSSECVQPEDDFAVGLIGQRRVMQRGASFRRFSYQKLRLAETLDLQLMLTDPVEPSPGEMVLVVGKPHQGRGPNTLACSWEPVCFPEVASALAEASTRPDLDIPYDSEAEFVVQSTAVSGMSGGGVFNQQGHLIGILSRANHQPLWGKYSVVRAVRISHIKARLLAVIRELPAQERYSFYPYLSALWVAELQSDE